MNAPANARQTILIVDDTPDNIMLLSRLLKDRYNTKVATNGSTALQIAQSSPDLDLVLLDVMMPGVDGYETCRQLKADPRTAAIPVIFLTAKSQVEDEATGLALGAADYLAKPISPPILFARVATQLALASSRRLLTEQNAQLEQMVQQRTAELSLLQEAGDHGPAAPAGDAAAAALNQSSRVAQYVRALALQLQQDARFSAELTEQNIAALAGARSAGDAGTRYTHEIARAHWEKWDGSGFPEGLAGARIPLAARLMAVVDVYDALVSQRVYRSAFSHQEALAIMAKARASHFDPDILDAMFAVEQRFAAIGAQCGEGQAEGRGA